MPLVKFSLHPGKIGAVGDELPETNYYFVPVIVITLGAYFIADVFFGVYNMAVDTLFLCFLEVSNIYETLLPLFRLHSLSTFIFVSYTFHMKLFLNYRTSNEMMEVPKNLTICQKI